MLNRHNTETAVRANEFAREASHLGAQVIYTQQVLDLNRLTPRQRRWENPDGMCAAGSWGAELFIDPIPGSHVVVKHRFDCWQSPAFVNVLETLDIDGLVIGGVELVCCVLYAVQGAYERGYHYLVPQDLISGFDGGDDTQNRAIRDFLRYNQPEQAIDDSNAVLAHWRRRVNA